MNQINIEKADTQSTIIILRSYINARFTSTTLKNPANNIYHGLQCDTRMLTETCEYAKKNYRKWEYPSIFTFRVSPACGHAFRAGRYVCIRQTNGRYLGAILHGALDSDEGDVIIVR